MRECMPAKALNTYVHEIVALHRRVEGAGQHDCRRVVNENVDATKGLHRLLHLQLSRRRESGSERARWVIAPKDPLSTKKTSR